MRGCEEIFSELEGIIRKHGFIISNRNEIGDNCIIDFRHPKIKPEPPVSYFTSAVQVNKKTNVLTATIRSKVEGFKELYLDYCCERENGYCNQRCRPHVNMNENVLSVEATFFENPLKKFDRLLEEMK